MQFSLLRLLAYLTAAVLITAATRRHPALAATALVTIPLAVIFLKRGVRLSRDSLGEQAAMRYANRALGGCGYLLLGLIFAWLGFITVITGLSLLIRE